ncbi:KAP family NTPase [Pseudohongiella sp. SYSU M77423]|uniref:KAP family P-loop NTPase fold protein n=1 Tax=Pseudohongiella sp. SYSU M77423 TaxID=3042312 RepID=UPI00248093DF|nr:KAP family NTPase [Pseudohongiella sp. SYSU M77423]MDH7943850.1 KAP family NTPase [Pseudohongiella sp. SYSU M77423]
MSQDMSQLRFHGDDGRDEFKRAQIAEKVIALLKSDINVSPMVIDGHWGTGKTEFCFKLINEIENEHDGYRTLYINAFKADHADNPLMTILGEVLGLLPEGEQRESFIAKAIPVARYGIQTALKAGVSHLLRKNFDEIAEGLEQHLEDAAGKVIDASVSALLKDHEKSEENIAALQICLMDISKDEPILIFIDELDRCRPDFAVKMLEVVKHTFDVTGVKFVLVTNSHQLRAAINHCYGDAVDAQKYLDKFLKFRFSLPEKVPSDVTDNLFAAVSHCHSLIIQSDALKDTGIADRDGNFGFLRELIQTQHMTLREIETLVRHFEIYQTLSSYKGFDRGLIFGVMILRMFAVYIFCMKPEIAHSISQGRADAKEIGEILGIASLPDYQESSGEYPTYSEVTTVMIANDCPVNAELYQSQDPEKLRFWKSMIAQSWGGRVVHPGLAIRQLSDVLAILSLERL